MKRNVKRRNSNTYLDLSLNKNYKVRKLQGYETEQTVSGNPANNKAIEDAKAFARRWYIHPTTRAMLEQVDPRARVYQEDYTRELPNGVQANADMARVYDAMDAISNTPINYVELDNGTGGNYNPYKDEININTLYYKPNDKSSKGASTVLHELEHAVQYAIPYVVNKTQPFRTERNTAHPGWTNGFDERSNIRSEREIRSRLMEFRKHFNLKPDKRDYTPEDVELMFQNTNSLTPDGVMQLQMYTPETIANYLNFTADAGDIDTQQPSNNLITPSYDEGVSMASNGGRLKLNKFGGGGKMTEASRKVAEEAFNAENVGKSVGAIGGAAMEIVGAAKANAEVDTSSADNAIEAVNNHKLDTSSLDALSSSYNSTPWAATDYNFKDFRPGGGELAMNTLKATMQGASAGASVGGPWGAIAGAAVGLGSSLGGIFAGRAKAKKEELRLEAEAKIANQSLQAQANANRDAIMQQQADTFLQNIAAEGGQLEFKEGEEYDLSYKDIYKLKNKGYDIDIPHKINDEVEIDPSELESLKNLGYEFEII